MAGTDTVALDSLVAAHPALPPLGELIAALDRQDHLVVGAERAQHAALLLRELQAAGIALATPRAAALWLGPVLCVTRHDRALLERRLERMCPEPTEPVAPKSTLAPLPGEPAQRGAGGENTTRPKLPVLLREFGVGALVALIAAALILVLPELFVQASGIAAPKGALADGDDLGMLEQVLPWLAALATSAGALFAFGRLRRAGEPLPGAMVPVRQDAPDPWPSGRGLVWFDAATLQSPLRAMGSELRIASRRIDLPGTVRRTIRRAGWPSIVRGGRARTPEHVVLVELRSADDPQTLAAAAVLQRLQTEGLLVHPYRFIGTPLLLTPWDGGEELPLYRVAALHRGRRLLVLSDGAMFYDALEETVSVPPEFEDFAVRALLTPLSHRSWGLREAVLAGGGSQGALAADRAFAVFEQSTEGVRQLARWLPSVRDTVAMPAEGAPVAPPDFADLLARDPSLFGAEPPRSDLRAMLDQRLRIWLGERAHDLLRVLAIGRFLPPGAVERVAAHLAAQDVPPPGEEPLLRLLRLPWFARGALPGWLRADLLRELPDELAACGRLAWQLHLADITPSRGRVAADDHARLQAATARLLDTTTVLADPLMRRMLLPSPEVEGQAIAPRWRSFLPSQRVIAIAALLLAGAWLASWLMGRAGIATPTPHALFAPLRLIPGLGSGGVATLVVLLLAVTPLWRRVPWQIAWSSAGAALYAACGAVMLAVIDPRYNDFEVATSPVAGMLLATLGVVGLALVRAPPEGWQLDLRAALLPANPWINLVGIVALAGSAALLDFREEDDFITVVLAREFLRAFCAAVLAGTLALRLEQVGATDAVSARKAGAVLFAAYLIGTGAAFLVLTAWPQQLRSIEEWSPGFVFIDLGLAVAGLVTAARFGVGLPVVRLMVAAGGYALWCLAVNWNDVGAIEPVALLLPSVPIRVLLLATVTWSNGISRPRTVGLLLALALIIHLGLSLPVGWLLDDLKVLGDHFTAFVSISEWILVLPMLRALRPDLALPSSGLWWRASLLSACWISVSALGMSLSAPVSLAVPIAAWIAHRHGRRALPAIALALLPTILRFRGSFGPIGFSVGSINVGWALGALLVAWFVADRAFRDACLAATRLSAGQLAVLALLPFAYASPQFFGIDFHPSMFGLVVVLCTLIGLSAIPLRAPAVVLGGVMVFGLVVAVTVGLPGTRTIGSLVIRPSGDLRDLVTLSLAFLLFRALREPDRERFAARLGAWLNANALPVALLVGGISFLAGANIQFRFPTGQRELSFALLPFVAFQLAMLVCFWGASRTYPRLVERLLPAMLRPIPWPVIVGTLTLAPSLLPAIRFEVGPPGLVKLSVQLFGSSPTFVLTWLLTIWAFWRLGEGLRPLLDSATPPATTPAKHPAFTTWMVRAAPFLLLLPAVALTLVLGAEMLALIR